MVGIGLAGNLADMKKIFRKINDPCKLIDHDRRCSSTDVHCFKLISEFCNPGHLCAQIIKITAGKFFTIAESIKGAVWTKSFAEGDMNVKRVLPAGLSGGQTWALILPDIHE